MQLQSSYIFLKNPKKKVKVPKKDGVITVALENEVISAIKELFPLVQEVSSFYSLYKNRYECKIGTDKEQCNVEFAVTEVVGNIYLDVVATGQRKNYVIKCLESVQTAIQSSKTISAYTWIISYDAVSEYYCNNLYPKLNELERNLRKLLLNIYVVNFGRDYYHATISPELQEKTKKLIKAKGGTEKKEVERLQKFFYSLEFGDVQTLLFTPSWTDFDEKERQRFLSENERLSALSEEQLREAFSKFSLRSDWERFFSDKISDIDAQKLIEEIRETRNNVAHCKFLYKEEYRACAAAISSLNKAILSAIAITEEKDFADKNREHVWQTIRMVVEKVGELTIKVAERVVQAGEDLAVALGAFVERYQSYQNLLPDDENIPAKELPRAEEVEAAPRVEDDSV